MTVSTLTNQVVYLGNGVTTSFSVPFKVLDKSHLVVQRRVKDSGEIDYTYIGTEYSYSGLGNDSGTLTLEGTALSSTYEIVIKRVVPYTQDLDLVNSGGFYPETTEQQLDLTTMQIQQVADEVSEIMPAVLQIIEESPFTVTSADGQSVSTRGLLAGIASPTNGQMAYLSEAGRSGWFKFTSGNYAARITADPYEGIYIESDTVASTSGAWVRERPAGIFLASWYGMGAANNEATNKLIWTSIFAANLPGNIDIEVPAEVFYGVAQIPYQTTISTVTIRGAIPPATWGGTLSSGGYALSNYGPIMKSAATAGGVVSGGVIEVLGSGGSLSRVKLNVINMGIRTYDNPNQHGIMAYYAEQLHVDGCAIDTGIWPEDATQPTETRYGIRVPKVGNGALSSIRNTYILNFRVGHDVSEHLVTDNNGIFGCRYGKELMASNHGANTGRDGVYRCTTPILVSGALQFNFDQLDIERVNATNEPGHWQISTYDIEDTLNLGTGTIKVVPVLGYSGPVSTFTRSGGRNITVEVEGSPTVAKYHRTTNLALATGVQTAITFTSAVNTPAIVLDTGTMQRVTYKENGVFRHTFNASVAANATGIRRVRFFAQDGTLLGEDSRNATSSGATSFNACVDIRVTSLIDYIVVTVEQTSGGSLDLVCSSYLSTLTIEKISG